MSKPGRSTVSVVVLAGGRLEQLLQCLESLRSGTRVPDQTVIVDNDASGAVVEALDELLADKSFPIERIKGPRGGYAEARNAGVAKASGKRIAFLDDDCIADRHWLERLEAALDVHDAVGGSVLPHRRLRMPRDWTPELNWLAGISTPGCWGRLAGVVDIPSTSNVAFRRSVWEECPFQEIGGELAGTEERSNYLVGREDAQWWRALRKAGLRTAMEPRAIVWHDIDETRLDLETTVRRAQSDGLAHWRREQPSNELTAAAADVVHAPLRVFFDGMRTDKSFAQAYRLHHAWTHRQWALLGAAVDDHEADVSPQRRTGMLARAGVRAAVDLAKPVVRGGASLAWHELRPRKRIPTTERPPRRLLVASYPFLGDTILLLPMLRAAKEQWPKTEITALVGPSAAPVYRKESAIDRVRVLPGGLNGKDPRASARVAREVRDARPDAILVPFWHKAPTAGLFASGAPVAMWSHDNGIAQRLWFDLADVLVEKDQRQHELVSIANLAAAFGIQMPLERPVIAPSDEAVERVERFLRKFGIEREAFAVLHMDAPSTHRKYWPAERYGALARHLFERHGLRSVFHGHRTGRGMFERMDLPEEIAVSLHGRLDAMEVCALCAGARVCVGVDSGPQHLAQAVGCPTLTLFDNLLEPRWKPLPRVPGDGDRPLPFRTLIGKRVCRDWGGFEHDAMAPNECFERIEIDEAIEALDSLLEESAATFSV